MSCFCLAMNAASAPAPATRPAAKEGEPESIDRVIKILTLKRRYKEDREKVSEEWKV